jgi:hypothetical protein
VYLSAQLGCYLGPEWQHIGDQIEAAFVFAGGLAHILVQSQPFPQLHSLLSFMGQFFPVFLQLGLSAAKAAAQIAAVRIE